jgi:hypothetical protein
VAQALIITQIQTDLLAIKAKLLATVGSLTLKWNANTEPDLAGYRIYCGTHSTVYDLQLAVEKTLVTGVVTNLTSGTYYCVVKAYDTAGNESGPSQEVSKVIP